MKNPLIALALAFAALTAATAAPLAPSQAAPSQAAPTQTSGLSKAQKKAAKLKRRERQADIYKGPIAKQARLVEDAPNAQKDKEPAEDKKEK